MRVIDCEQGTDEWFQARAGKVTASRIADMMAKARTGSGWGVSRTNYRDELVLERLMGRPAGDKFKSKAMDRGNEVEPKAREMYAFIREDVTQVGFVLHPTIDDAGCSPDGLVGADGLIQIKCPDTKTHFDTLLGAPIDGGYLKQVQWEMACTGRKWCDFVSFDDRVPLSMQIKIIRVERDPIIIAKFEHETREFLKEVEARHAALIAQFQPEAA